MANLKNITELPVAQSTEDLNLIVVENGCAKQIPANEVGAQADWAETDENSPAFIKNKPVEGYDAVITLSQDSEGNNVCALTSGSYTSLQSKINNGEVPNVLIIGQWSYGDVYEVRCESRSCYLNTANGIVNIHSLILPYTIVIALDSDGTLSVSNW